MKAIKILIFTIILVLVLGASAVALVYFYTDTFKTNQEIFYKYISEDQASKLIDTNSINNLINRMDKEKTEQEIKATVNASLDDDIVLDGQTIELVNKIDNPNKLLESRIIFGNMANENIVELGLVRNNNKYGLIIEDVINQYMAVENKRLKSFADNLGIDSQDVPNKIEAESYTNIIAENTTKIEDSFRELYGLLKNNTDKTNYSKIGKTKITLNGVETSATGYELTINNNQFKNILEKAETDILKNINTENLNLELTVKIYLQNRTLVKCEVELQDVEKTLSIKLEKEERGLSLSYNNLSANQEITIKIENNGNPDSNEFLYTGAVIANLGEDALKINIEFEAKFVFDSDFEITKLTNENSVILNDIEGNKVLNMLNIVIQRTLELEGAEDTLLNFIIDYELKETEIIKKASESAEEQAVQAFNSRFTAYEGTTTGINVKSVITVVETSNSASDLKVKLSYNGEEKEVSQVMEEVNSSKQYRVSFEYDDAGYINVIKIDG